MKRLYEWRFKDNGALSSEPRMAENACAFTAESFAKFGVHRQKPNGPPTRVIVCVVSATGERVETEENLAAGTCRLANSPETGWYFADGRSAK